MKEPVLMILAAGMGSRYGGLKQIDPVGDNGEIIIDYSLYDAFRAGFKKAVFVIKEENLEDFKSVILPKAGKYMEIEFVFQDINDIPKGCKVPESRTKPWGTGHAVLSGKDVIDAPFAVINADDFYGREAFKSIYDFLVNVQDIKNSEVENYAMVGFYLKNTITDNGYVSRGICQVEDGKLKSVVERTRIERTPDGIAYSEDEGKTWNILSDDSMVSMNFWGFTPSLFAALEKDFSSFFENEVKNNPLKSEFFLPFVVNDMVNRGRAEVKLLSSSEKWYGVTYKQDKDEVTTALRGMVKDGIYPSPLW